MLITLVSITNFASEEINTLSMEKEPILLKFGKNVQKIRKIRHLSQEQLAGVHRTYIGMIERAEKNITLYNIERIAKGLNVPIVELLSVNDND